MASDSPVPAPAAPVPPKAPVQSDFKTNKDYRAAQAAYQTDQGAYRDALAIYKSQIDSQKRTQDLQSSEGDRALEQQKQLDAFNNSGIGQAYNIAKVAAPDAGGAYLGLREGAATRKLFDSFYGGQAANLKSAATQIEPLVQKFSAGGVLNPGEAAQLAGQVGEGARYIPSAGLGAAAARGAARLGSAMIPAAGFAVAGDRLRNQALNEKDPSTRDAYNAAGLTAYGVGFGNAVEGGKSLLFPSMPDTSADAGIVRAGQKVLANPESVVSAPTPLATSIAPASVSPPVKPPPDFSALAKALGATGKLPNDAALSFIEQRVSAKDLAPEERILLRQGLQMENPSHTFKNTLQSLRKAGGAPSILGPLAIGGGAMMGYDAADNAANAAGSDLTPQQHGLANLGGAAAGGTAMYGGMKVIQSLGQALMKAAPFVGRVSPPVAAGLGAWTAGDLAGQGVRGAYDAIPNYPDQSVIDQPRSQIESRLSPSPTAATVQMLTQAMQADQAQRAGAPFGGASLQPAVPPSIIGKLSRALSPSNYYVAH